MPSRRQFLAATAATAAGTPAVHAGHLNTLKLALVGCGGRGSGAAAQALTADKDVKLVAVADVFADQAAAAAGNLKKLFGDRADVAPDRQFAGFDAYKPAIDAADVVVLATAPGFRPQHFAYAVERNKHVFMEKPHAVDGTGVRSILASAKLAKEKGLSVISGFTYRFDAHKRDVVARLHAGEIGDIQVIHTNYLTGELWDRSGKSKTPDPRQVEYQLRMWYYFPWLSGDFLVEQAIHNVDKACWVMNGKFPVSAVGLGGRQARTADKFGTVWDHFSVCYEYADGAKVFLNCRQIEGCVSETSDHVYGTKGTCDLMRHTITAGGKKWRREGEHNLGAAYQLEHDELFAAIRSGKPVNDAEASAYSTLMGIMGREAAYSGQRITWDQMLKSKQNLVPAELAWAENPVPPVARPGRKSYKFV
jgi:predicted dehydrogenase